MRRNLLDQPDRGAGCEQTVTRKVEGPNIFRGLDFFCGRSVPACGELATGWSENKGGMGEYWSKLCSTCCSIRPASPCSIR